MREQTTNDVRFSVPLYTQAEAARYLSMPSTTFRSWTHRYERVGRTGRLYQSDPVVTQVAVSSRTEPSVPFIGLAEAVFLAALRRANVPMQQIRPALQLVKQRLGVRHALASNQLHVAGAQLLWEVSDESELDPNVRSSLPPSR